MEPSLFARLSPELRNEIYELAFDSNYAVTLQPNKTHHGLTQTCRPLRQETLGMYYSLARFNAHLDDGPATPLARWLTAIGRENCLLLREVNVWDLHMLNATLHGAGSTAHMLGKTHDDGTRYVLRPTGDWLLGRGWYLKDIVMALHALGLELRNLSTIRQDDEETAAAGMTSHFAIASLTPRLLVDGISLEEERLCQLLHCLGFLRDMIEEVLRLLHLLRRSDGSRTGEHSVGIRRGRRDIFITCQGFRLLSIRQTFIPHDENFAF